MTHNFPFNILPKPGRKYRIKTKMSTIMALVILATAAQAKTYQKPFPFDQSGCVRHIKAIAKAVKDAGGEAKKNDSSDRSYRMTLDGTTTIYTCTRHELLETEI